MTQQVTESAANNLQITMHSCSSCSWLWWLCGGDQREGHSCHWQKVGSEVVPTSHRLSWWFEGDPNESNHGAKSRKSHPQGRVGNVAQEPVERKANGTSSYLWWPRSSLCWEHHQTLWRAPAGASAATEIIDLVFPHPRIYIQLLNPNETKPTKSCTIKNTVCFSRDMTLEWSRVKDSVYCAEGIKLIKSLWERKSNSLEQKPLCCWAEQWCCDEAIRFPLHRRHRRGRILPLIALNNSVIFHFNINWSLVRPNSTLFQTSSSQGLKLYLTYGRYFCPWSITMGYGFL